MTSLACRARLLAYNGDLQRHSKGHIYTYIREKRCQCSSKVISTPFSQHVSKLEVRQLTPIYYRITKRQPKTIHQKKK